jgi:hypothetical protein
MKKNQYQSLHGYVFGEGYKEGLALLTGCAGVEADYKMDRQDFEGIIKCSLSEEDEELREELPMLLEEFADKDVLDELYAEFQARGKARAKQLAEEAA